MPLRHRLGRIAISRVSRPRATSSLAGYDSPSVASVISADGAILERVIETAHSNSSEGLSRHAYAQFEAAQARTTWGRHHRRRLALVDGNDVLAGATQYDLAAVLDQGPVRVCGLGSIFSEATDGDGVQARDIIARVIVQA